MEKCKFMSVFAPYMQKFVDAKEALGFSRKYFESVLGLLDRFFIEEKVRTPFITSVLIDKWGHTLINNSYKTICSKYSILAQFAKYMNNIGFLVMYLEFQRAKPIRMHHTSSRTNKCFPFLQCVILLWPAITEIWTAVFFLYLPFFACCMVQGCV